ncbi:MAG: PD40 domain-containing protein [Bacteroidia bacterium]|nr:PD40 domain-containing protein [Bacteroidia bacterium]
MKKHFNIIFLFVIFCFVCAENVIAVEDKNNELKDLIDEGNKLLTKGQFSSAIAIWQKVLEQDSENANANFKMGLCYFNSIDEQSKALVYFRKSTKNLKEKYDFNNNDEKSAPYDALYFLGCTYLTIGESDSAIFTFLKYDDQFAGNAPIPVDRVIRNCINSKNALKNPRDIVLKNPGKNINSLYSETNPVITLDNSIIFFATRRDSKEGNKTISNITGKFDQDIYYSIKDASGKWEKSLPFKWNTNNDEAPLCLSSDGLTLYLYVDDDGQKDIFESRYIDKVWSKPEPVSKINSSANETGVTISADGKYLYFCSDREGGNGKYDIYQCVKSGKNWGKPKNIGKEINTSNSEISPFINPDGKTLFFSSNGYFAGLGGYDIYYSELKDNGTWTKPESMGYPINTNYDDVNYYIIGGQTRYYSTIREEKDSYDIYKIEGGGFAIENIDANSQVVTLTKEMAVTDILEVEKTVEKEIEVIETIETTVEVIREVELVDIEKEKMKMDSIYALARSEAQIEKQKLEADKIRAEAERIKAEIDSKKIEADKMKADAEIKKAEAEIAKQSAIKAAADAAKAKSDAIIAAAQKSKDDLAKAKVEAELKKSESLLAQSNALKAKAEADKAKSEEAKIKIEADKLKLATDKAKADESILLLKNQLAETEKPKYEALKIQAEATKSKAEADKLKSLELIAAAQKIKDEAVIAKVEITKANASAKLADAQKAKDDAIKVKADLEIKKAEALQTQSISLKAKAEADKAKSEELKSKTEADKAKSESDKAKAVESALILKNQLAETEKPKYEALKIQAEADKLKAQELLSRAQKAKDDATIAKAEATKANAEILKAKADIAISEKAKADAVKADADAKKAAVNLEIAKANAEAKKAKLEILKLQPQKK